MTTLALPAMRRVTIPGSRRVWALGLVVATILLYLGFHDTATLPHDEDAPVFRTLNGVRDWVDANRTSALFSVVVRPVSEGISQLVGFLRFVLTSLTWPAFLAIGATIGIAVGGWRIGILALLGFASLGILGLWTQSLDTLALTISAVLVSLALGIPIGILAGRNDRLQRVLAPVLDVMQIMPTFAYLAPFALLFGIGAPTATIVTLIYAMPATIRITSLAIRGVSGSAMEAAASIGATRWQMMRKVILPLARRTIGLAINQTIMLALSMVVIAALIDAPGLGATVVRGLTSLDVGATFNAGVAIVIVAIVLDRVTAHLGERLDRRGASIGTGLLGRPLLLVATTVSVLALVFGPAIAKAGAFPTAVSFSFRVPVNTITHWIELNAFGITQAIKDGFSNLLINPLQGILTSAPWWLVVGVIFAVALLVSRLRAAVATAICLGLIAGLQLWEHAMETLASVLVATAITLFIGIALGIQSARHDRFGAFLRPTLDAAQTMPAFVYLIPALALFGAGHFTGIVAAVIFAAPPVIRLVDAGIRGVPMAAVEAATSAGASAWQLLRKVQLPMARQSLLLAANQGIVQVLAMVVVGGLVGAGALGFDVVTGFSQGVDFGKGLAAGLATVLLGIMLDRITQGAGAHQTARMPA